MRLWRRYKPCPDCVLKGKPSTWLVPAHTNYWAWGQVPAYRNWCFTCGGCGKVRI